LVKSGFTLLYRSCVYEAAMDMQFDTFWTPGVDSNRALRPFGWSELCARLVAAQDTRREALSGFACESAAQSDSAGGSFHSLAATLLSRDEAIEPSEAEDVVNPMPSANGKYAGDTRGGRREPAEDLSRAELSRRELP
jgi:hypothetical protein